MKQRPLVSRLQKSLAVALCLGLSSLSFAEGSAAEATSPLDIPARKVYKGEVDSANYAATYIPKEGRYGGQVFNGDLYQGAIEGPAYTPSSDRSLHDGFYLGAEAGYDSYKMRANINTQRSGFSVFQENPELNAVGLSYTLVGGYGRVFDDPLYIGAEFFYNTSQANTAQNIGLLNNTRGIYYLKSVVLGAYGVSLIPGIKIGESALLYLRGGYTRMEAKTYENSGLLGINNSQSNGTNGVHYGLGFEVAIYKNVSIRGEYTHLNAENFKITTNTTITPSNNQFMFGLIYHVL